MLLQLGFLPESSANIQQINEITKEKDKKDVFFLMLRKKESRWGAMASETSCMYLWTLCKSLVRLVDYFVTDIRVNADAFLLGKHS